MTVKSVFFALMISAAATPAFSEAAKDPLRLMLPQQVEVIQVGKDQSSEESRIYENVVLAIGDSLISVQSVDFSLDARSNIVVRADGIRANSADGKGMLSIPSLNIALSDWPAYEQHAPACAIARNLGLIEMRSGVIDISGGKRSHILEVGQLQVDLAKDITQECAIRATGTFERAAIRGQDQSSVRAEGVAFDLAMPFSGSSLKEDLTVTMNGREIVTSQPGQISPASVDGFVFSGGVEADSMALLFDVLNAEMPTDRDNIAKLQSMQLTNALSQIKASWHFETNSLNLVLPAIVPQIATANFARARVDMVSGPASVSGRFRNANFEISAKTAMRSLAEIEFAAYGKVFPFPKEYLLRVLRNEIDVEGVSFAHRAALQGIRLTYKDIGLNETFRRVMGLQPASYIKKITPAITQGQSKSQANRTRSLSQKAIEFFTEASLQKVTQRDIPNDTPVPIGRVFTRGFDLLSAMDRLLTLE